MNRKYFFIAALLLFLISIVFQNRLQAQLSENLDELLITSIKKQIKENGTWKFLINVPREYTPDFKLSVNGSAVDVVKFQEVSYANLDPANNFEIILSANIPLTNIEVSPKSKNLCGKLKNGKFYLRLVRPEKLVLTCNGNYRFLIFANGIKKTTIPENQQKVINADLFDIDKTGRSDSTAGIQKAIDLASQQKGIAFIPKGLYQITSLEMKSNMTLFLESGTVLKLLDDDSKRTVFVNNWKKNHRGSIGCLYFNKVKNVKVVGLGTIDCRGSDLHRNKDKNRMNFSVLFSMDSDNIEIHDVILKDPPGWNSHMTNSNGVLFDNVKLINNININNTDGIDPDNCARVTVKDSFVYSSDDCIVIKTFYHNIPAGTNGRPLVVSKDIFALNNVLWTRANAMKIGTETYRDMKNIRFENNDIVHAAIACTVEIRNGGQMTDLAFINNRVESIGDICGSRIFHFAVRKWFYDYQKAQTLDLPSYGSVTNLTIKNFHVYQNGKSKSALTGLNETSLLKNISFDNFTVNGKKILSPEDLPFSVGNYVLNISFK